MYYAKVLELFEKIPQTLPLKTLTTTKKQTEIKAVGGAWSLDKMKNICFNKKKKKVFAVESWFLHWSTLGNILL